eukprot:1776425-Rhodomonas_salina.1
MEVESWKDGSWYVAEATHPDPLQLSRRPCDEVSGATTEFGSDGILPLPYASTKRWVALSGIGIPFEAAIVTSITSPRKMEFPVPMTKTTVDVAERHAGNIREVQDAGHAELNRYRVALLNVCNGVEAGCDAGGLSPRAGSIRKDDVLKRAPCQKVVATQLGCKFICGV